MRQPCQREQATYERLIAQGERRAQGMQRDRRRGLRERLLQSEAHHLVHVRGNNRDPAGRRSRAHQGIYFACHPAQHAHPQGLAPVRHHPARRTRQRPGRAGAVYHGSQAQSKRQRSVALCAGSLGKRDHLIAHGYQPAGTLLIRAEEQTVPGVLVHREARRRAAFHHRAHQILRDGDILFGVVQHQEAVARQPAGKLRQRHQMLRKNLAHQ